MSVLAARPWLVLLIESAGSAQAWAVRIDDLRGRGPGLPLDGPLPASGEPHAFELLRKGLDAALLAIFRNAPFDATPTLSSDPFEGAALGSAEHCALSFTAVGADFGGFGFDAPVRTALGDADAFGPFNVPHPASLAERRAAIGQIVSASKALKEQALINAAAGPASARLLDAAL